MASFSVSPAPRIANPASYRTPRIGGGGLYNGYATPRAKQAWNVGNTVSVGFVKNLLVVARIATPGDGRPDCYALLQQGTGRWYQFQPHLGLVRCDDERQAREG